MKPSTIFLKGKDPLQSSFQKSIPPSATKPWSSARGEDVPTAWSDLGMSCSGRQEGEIFQ